jgi:hypothetical protein
MISKATMKNTTIPANADTLVAFSLILVHRILSLISLLIRNNADPLTFTHESYQIDGTKYIIL